MSVKEKDPVETTENNEELFEGIKTISPTKYELEEKKRRHRNYSRRKNQAVRKARRRHRIIALIIILAILCGCAYPAYKFWFIPYSAESHYNNMKISLGQKSDSLPEGYLEKFGKIYSENKDVGGWILVAGTNINYPVMSQANHNSSYWESHLPNGWRNDWGAPYFVSTFKPDGENKNTAVFANDILFGELSKYSDINFYRTSPILSVDTLKAEGYYKVFATFTMAGQEARKFNNNDFKTDKEFAEFIEEIGKNSVITTPVTVESTDKILSVFTQKGDMYTIVFARLMRNGEEAAMDTSSAKAHTPGEKQSKLFKSTVPAVSSSPSKTPSASSAASAPATSSASQSTPSSPVSSDTSATVTSN